MLIALLNRAISCDICTMKQYLTIALSLLCWMNSNAQFNKIVVEEVENEGKVPGKTYRIYAELMNEGDQLYIVYGDSLHPLKIESTKPFYQAKKGAAYSKLIQRNDIAKSDSLKYDSWLTIGAIDNYDNNTGNINFDPSAFETEGKGLECHKDGGWFCYPTDKQAYCGPSKRILLMQLTTKGVITGSICLMGKTVKGEVFKQNDITFTAGERKGK